MQVITEELKELNKKLDTLNTRMIATNDLMIIMNDKLTSAQRVMLGFMVVSSAATIIVALKNIRTLMKYPPVISSSPKEFLFYTK
ncbi:unnamed protein product [Rotaria socialis]|nr:unnamed protein product [Rotaria socialis]CAF4578338.1 unnamed protein product [Rotaria socialis]